MSLVWRWCAPRALAIFSSLRTSRTFHVILSFHQSFHGVFAVERYVTSFDIKFLFSSLVPYWMIRFVCAVSKKRLLRPVFPFAVA